MFTMFPLGDRSSCLDHLSSKIISKSSYRLYEPFAVVTSEELQPNAAGVEAIIGELLLQYFHSLISVQVTAPVMAFTRMTCTQQNTIRIIKQSPQDVLGVKTSRTVHT